MPLDNETLITLTSDIISAHVSNNTVASEDIAGAIQGIYAALQGLDKPVETVPEKPTGAVSVRSSVKPGHIVSMIDGKPYKMLKRHLTINGYTPESYRETFGLPRDYPMVAAEYAEKRRGLALKIGLGRKPTVEAKPAKKTRAKKAPTAAKSTPQEG